MKDYRNRLKLQTVCSAVGLVLLLAVIALSFMEIITPVGGDSHWASFWNGFIGGGTAAFAAVLLINIILNLRAMSNPEKLRAQYIKEHDERTRQIWMLSGASAYWFDVLGLLLAAVIVGYYIPAASIAIVAALFYICLVRAALKLYYHKKL